MEPQNNPHNLNRTTICNFCSLKIYLHKFAKPVCFKQLELPQLQSSQPLREVASHINLKSGRGVSKVLLCPNQFRKA